MARKEYTGAPASTTITAGINAVSTSFSIAVSTGWPTGAVGPFTCVIDPGLSSEEKIFCSALAAGVLTVAASGRGYDGTTATGHSSGAVIYPVPSAHDFDEANLHVNTSSAVHSVTGAVVGTTDVQTLTNKTLTAPTINAVTITGAATAPTPASGNNTTTVATTAFVVATTNTGVINNQTGTAYTPTLADAWASITLSNAAAIAVTIPTDASVAFPVGTEISFQWAGVGQPTISAVTPATTTITSNADAATQTAPKIGIAGGWVTVKKMAANSWNVIGRMA